MTRVAICGGPELAAAAAALGLVEGERPELVIVDARSDDPIARAASVAPEIPRIVVADGARAALLRAAGHPHVASAATPEALGPLVAAAAPRRDRDATRLVVVTAARGGSGRTLLAANLARRLARRLPLWVVDATGTGAAAWWLRADARPWSELESLAAELSIEHLGVVAAEPLSGVRVLGGGGPAPSAALLAACLRELTAAGELAIVDAPLLSDERTGALLAAPAPARRALVLSYGDPASLAALDAQEVAGDAWLIASQCRRLGDRDVFGSLPRDESALALALAARSAAGGALGRAYDDLAELISIDAT